MLLDALNRLLRGNQFWSRVAIESGLKTFVCMRDGIAIARLFCPISEIACCSTPYIAHARRRSLMWGLAIQIVKFSLALSRWVNKWLGTRGVLKINNFQYLILCCYTSLSAGQYLYFLQSSLAMFSLNYELLTITLPMQWCIWIPSFSFVINGIRHASG